MERVNILCIRVPQEARVRRNHALRDYPATVCLLYNPTRCLVSLPIDVAAMQLITSLLALLSASLSLAAPSTPAAALVARVPTPAEQAAYLDSHNANRAQHGAAPLAWDASLASAAQTWANGCIFAHSGGTVGPYGENLAAGTGTFGPEEAVRAWTDEACESTCV